MDNGPIMTRAFDGTPTPVELPIMSCGGTPMFDFPSGCSYRCDLCNAVIGSVGQPRRCKELNKDDRNY